MSSFHQPSIDSPSEPVVELRVIIKVATGTTNRIAHIGHSLFRNLVSVAGTYGSIGCSPRKASRKRGCLYVAIR